jgi:hypothetical protein
MDVHSIEQKLNSLTDELRREVMDFIDFLLSKKRAGTKQAQTPFDFLWEGGLSDVKDKYSSVELQHRSLDWR